MGTPTFCEVEAALDNVRNDVNNNKSRYTGAVAQILAAKNAVANLATTYAAVATEINAQATALPNDTAWKMAKARLDKIVAEYNALRTKLQAAVDALTAIG